MSIVKQKIGDSEVTTGEDDSSWEPVPRNENEGWEVAPNEKKKDDRGLIHKGWDLINTPLTTYLPDSARQAVRFGLAHNPVSDLGLNKVLGLNDETIKGIEEGKANISEGLITPLSLGTFGASGLLAKSPLIARSLSAAFAGASGKGAYDNAKEFYNAKTPEEKGKALTELVGNTAFAGLAGLYAKYGGHPKELEKPPVIEKPESLIPTISSDEFYQSDINEPLPKPWLSQDEKGKYLINNKTVDKYIEENYPQLKGSPQDVKRNFLINQNLPQSDAPQYNKFDTGLEYSQEANQAIANAQNKIIRPIGQEISGNPTLLSPIEGTTKAPELLKTQAQIAADKAGVPLQRTIEYPNEIANSSDVALANNPLIEPSHKIILKRPLRSFNDNVDIKSNPIEQSKLTPESGNLPTSGEIIKPFSKPIDTSNLNKLPTKYQEQFPWQSMEGVETGKDINKPTAPATYLGYQDMSEIPGQKSYDLYNLTQDLPGHPKNSSVSGETLEKMGYQLPAKPTTGKPLKSASENAQTGGSLYSGLSAIPEAMQHVKNTYEDLKNNFGDYVPSLMKELGTQSKPYGITPDKGGKINPYSLKAKMLVRLSKPEQEMLKETGFNSWLESKGNQKISLDEAFQKLKENSPKIEVKKLEAIRDVSVEEKRIAEIEHNLDTKYPNWRRSNNDLTTLENNKDFKTQFDELVSLRKLKNTKVDNESATSRYTMVNPKPLSEMPGAVDILVKRERQLKPHMPAGLSDEEINSRGGEDALTISLPEQEKFSSQHYPIEGKNLIAHVRGYMETLPNGEKVFHVFEVQSDWAAKHAQDLETLKKESPSGFYDSNVKEVKNKSGDPTLSYYEHLALKAAIKHAVENGANKIAISDANTAMLSEQHDQNINHSIQPTEKNITVAKELLNRSNHGIPKGTLESIINGKSLDISYEGLANKFTDLGFESTETVSQEKGMRQHYDSSLPNIAAKLTGDFKPSRVDFGEHQNVREYDNRHTAEKGPIRGNLILKDKDTNLPQTNIKANMFDLSKVKPRIEQGEPFSTYGATYANPIGPMLKVASKTLAAGIEKVFHYDPTRPQIDKVAQDLGATGKYLAPRLTMFYDKLRDYRGQLVNSIEGKLLTHIPGLLESTVSLSAKKFGENLTRQSPELARVWQYLNDIQDKKPSTISLTPKEQLIVKDIRDNLLHSAAIQIGKNIPVWGKTGPRAKVIDPDYVPQVINQKTLEILANKQGSKEFLEAKKQFINYQFTKNGINPTHGATLFDDIVRSFKATDDSNKGNQFGPVDKAAGLGIPPEWRNMNALQALAQFNNRLARRFAYFDAIENDPLSRSALGINSDTLGQPTPKGLKLPTGEDVDYLGGNETLKPIIKDIEARRSTLDLKIDAANTTLKMFAMQAWSGARDLLSTNVLGWQHQLPSQYVGAFLHSWSHISEGIAEGLAKGIIRHDTISFEGMEGGVGDIITNLQRLRGTVGRLGLRNAFEQVTRGVTFEQGKFLALDNLLKLNKGNTNMQRLKFMKDFAYDINWKGKTSLTPEEVGTIAARYTESVQGTYDYRGLPRATQEGAGSVILNWNRWNIEKKNNFIKNVISPLKEGNYWPLIGTVAGVIVGGEAIQQIQQQISGGRKDKAPSFKEAIESEDRTGEALFYKLASLSDASGHAGILSSLAHNIATFRFNGKPQALFRYPLIESASQAITRVGQAIEAFEAGEHNVGINLLNQMAQDNIQNYRIIINQLSEDKHQQITEANRQRDLKTFQELNNRHGNYTPGESNPFLNEEEKKFKQNEDPNKVGELGIQAINKVLEVNKNDSSKMISKLQGLKNNQVTWMPSMEHDPLQFSKYLNFVKNTQGSDKAQKLINDYAMAKEVSKIKSELIPSLGGTR